MATKTGTSGNDTLVGTNGSDILIGDAGDDFIIGGQGDDLMVGGAGADTFEFRPGHGQDAIWDFDPEAGDIIKLSGFDGRVTWDALSEKFTVGNNILFGSYVEIDLTDWGGGTIQVWGVQSVDDLTEDMFILPGTDQTVTGTDDHEHFYGDWGDDTLDGGGGADKLDGRQGDDTLVGGAGNDYIVGGQGDDRIEGGTGNDTLFGDGGQSGDDQYADGTPTGETDNDTFVFAPGDGQDVIKDFRDGEDLIDLTAFTGISGFDDISARQSGSNVVIDFNNDNSITLSNFNLNDLDASDFIFYDASASVDGV